MASILEYTHQETLPSRAGNFLKFLEANGVRIPFGADILDAGAYTGIVSAEIVWRLAHKQVNVISCDLSPTPKDHTHGSRSLISHLTRQGPLYEQVVSGRLEVYEADYTCLGFIPPESLHLVLMLNNLSYLLLEVPVATCSHVLIKDYLQAIFRCMTQGARLVVWSEYIYAVNLILTKVGNKLVNTLHSGLYTECLLNQFKTASTEDLVAKIKNDQHWASFIGEIQFD